MSEADHERSRGADSFPTYPRLIPNSSPLRARCDQVRLPRMRNFTRDQVRLPRMRNFTHYLLSHAYCVGSGSKLIKDEYYRLLSRLHCPD